ncbi:HesA/MoeB/ThiF family protein [Mesonia sp. K7]|uniref:HesA/MoeB/ThiF family protein n=1 Tax=Mesonia sp. K7 TaxID=2218606 RepID=UPI000DA97F8A|nr:HesA/MoeB/ThiF family protein [Mesonia sp. K7]PZD78111.1 dinucleotide-utilizing protein [Mesonia sp. K7]
MQLSKNEYKHYSRHLLLDEIGESGQHLLKKSKVLVIGAGGLGCPTLLYLTAAGVGEIGIVDNDKVEVSNLQRQILYTVEDIGKSKSHCAAMRLKKLNPHIKITGHNEFLNKNNALSLFKNYDIIVDGSDNFATRYLTNDAAVITDRPFVYGAIHKFEGQVSVFNYLNGPTYRCLYQSPPQEHIPNCSEIGVLGVLPGIIGAFQANEVIKIICGLEEVLSGTLLIFQAKTYQTNKLKILKNERINISSLQESYSINCDSQQSYQELTWQEYKKNKTEYLLLDVRSAQEYFLANRGGLHIPIDELPQKLKEIPAGKNLLVCCQSGARSKKAIRILQENKMGNKLFNLKGGLAAYQ